MLDSVPPWTPLYERVLRETDNEKLPQALLELEEAMILRAMELSDTLVDERERDEFKQVAAELLRIKTERLGWPGI